MSTSADFIPASHIEAEKLNAPNAPQKIDLKPPKQGSYQRMYYSYNFGTPEQPKWGEPLFQMDICKASVKKKVGDDGREEWKLNCRLKNQDDMNGLTRLDQGRLRCIEKHKGVLRMPNFSAAHPGDTFRNMFFHPMNQETGELTGGDPIMSLKINTWNSSFEIMKNMDGDTEKLDHTQLEGQDLTVSVVWHLRDEYKGATPSPQAFVRNCVVLNMSSRGQVDQTKSANVMQYLQANPELLNTLADQIEKMKVQEKEAPSLLTETPAQPTNPPAPEPQTVTIPTLPQSQPAPTPQLPQMNVGQPAPTPQLNAGQPAPAQSPIDLTGYLNQPGGVTVQTL